MKPNKYKLFKLTRDDRWILEEFWTWIQNDPIASVKVKERAWGLKTTLRKFQNYLSNPKDETRTSTEEAPHD